MVVSFLNPEKKTLATVHLPFRTFPKNEKKEKENGASSSGFRNEMTRQGPRDDLYDHRRLNRLRRRRESRKKGHFKDDIMYVGMFAWSVARYDTVPTMYFYLEQDDKCKSQCAASAAVPLEVITLARVGLQRLVFSVLMIKSGIQNCRL